MSGVLIDTTILISAYQSQGSDPHPERAKKVLEELARRGGGSVSVQSLSEFTRILQTRASPPPPPARLREAVAQLELVFEVLRPSARTVSHALSAGEKHGIPFWDAMIWAVAHENGIDEVLTEATLPRPSIEGVLFRNPLA